MTNYCNAYGAENPNGAVNLGGYDPQPVVNQWRCTNRPDGRFRWVCEHDHKGSIVDLCEGHYREFSGFGTYQNGRPLPFTIARDVQFCPRCNTESDHRCSVRLVAVS